MSEIGAIQSGLYGLRTHLREFEETATRIVQDPLSDPARDFVDLQTRRHAVAASAKVVRAADELLGTLLDAVG